MLEGGAEIRYIQALLGHVSLSTTQIYTHVSIGKLCQVHQQTHPARVAQRSSDLEGQPAARPGEAGDATDPGALDDQAPTAPPVSPSRSSSDSSQPSAEASTAGGHGSNTPPDDDVASHEPGDDDDLPSGDAADGPSRDDDNDPLFWTFTT